MSRKARIRQDAYTVRNKNGKKEKRLTSKHYVNYTDRAGRYHEIPAFRDKGTSFQLGQLVEQLDIALEANIPLDAATQKRVRDLPEKIQRNLVKRGFIDKVLSVAVHSLDDEITSWAASLAANRVSVKYGKEAPARVRRVFKDCGFTRIGDITRAPVQTWLHDRRGESMGDETAKTYVRAVKAFGNWAVEEGRIDQSPLKHLKLPANHAPSAGKQSPRRALWPEQQKTIVRVAQDSTVIVRGMAGPSRAILYTVALESGARWSELYSLTVGSFSLDAQIPNVLIEAAHSKRRREDVIPLRRALVSKLRRYFKGRAKDEKAFIGMLKDKGAKMLRHDLAIAKIPYVTDEGVADFHALRHSFISNLTRAGVHPKMAQVLSRHSTVELTLGRYSHVELKEQADILEKVLSDK